MLYQLSYCPPGAALAVPPGGWPGPSDGRSMKATTARQGLAQRVSLWTVWVRSHRQNFFISMRSRSFILFLVVM